MLAVEPRLSVTENGLIRLTEALDDRGQSLLAIDGPVETPRAAGSFGITPAPTLSIRVNFDYPEAPGRRIKRLRGSIPVVVSTRKPGPVEIRLDATIGTFHRCDEVALSVLGQRPASPGQPSNVQLAIRPIDRSASARMEGWASPKPLDLPQDRLEILDAQGEAIPWFASRVFYDDEETRLTLTMDARESNRVPTMIRCHGLLRAKADVAFEFHDIPLP